MESSFIQSKSQTSTFQRDAATVHLKLKWHDKSKILCDAGYIFEKEFRNMWKFDWDVDSRLRGQIH